MTTYEIEHYNVYDTPNNNWVSTFPRYYMPVQLEVCKDSISQYFKLNSVIKHSEAVKFYAGKYLKGEVQLISVMNTY